MMRFKSFQDGVKTVWARLIKKQIDSFCQFFEPAIKETMASGWGRGWERERERQPAIASNQLRRKNVAPIFSSLQVSTVNKSKCFPLPLLCFNLWKEGKRQTDRYRQIVMMSTLSISSCFFACRFFLLLKFDEISSFLPPRVDFFFSPTKFEIHALQTRESETPIVLPLRLSLMRCENECKNEKKLKVASLWWQLTTAAVLQSSIKDQLGFYITAKSLGPNSIFTFFVTFHDEGDNWQ